MNTKKIYITPEINVINILTTYIMAGSNGGANSGIGTDPDDVITVTPDTGGSGGSGGSEGSGDGPVVQAKNNSFNAWETWEEY